MAATGRPRPPNDNPYPPIEPYLRGMLDVADGQSVYWEVSGNPLGKPVVVLHGGPGSGSTAAARRWFDPARYRIVLFDQRGAGRSTPSASNYSTSLAANTTEHLVLDIEALRAHLEIERWLVWGASWGATLALVYADRFPERVSEIVLAAVTMTRPREIDWLYRGARRFLPQQWQLFRNAVPASDRDGDLVAAYCRLLASPDPAVRERAARDWCSWEDALVSLDPNYSPRPRYEDPKFRMTYARIVTHYFKHAAWLYDDQILLNANNLRDIPGALIHGKFDVAAPPDTAWELVRAWPGATLRFVGGGHSQNAEMAAAIVAATDRFATA